MEEVEAAAERLRAAWVRYYHEVERPRECVSCGGKRVWKDGTRWRSATATWEGAVVTVARFPCRRVRCAACGRRWTLLPEGLLPGRHFGLDVLARAIEAHVFGPAASLARTAARFALSARTLGRVRDWVAGLAPPALLGSLVAERSGMPCVGTLLAAAERAEDAARQAVRERAAEVLSLLETLAAAAGLAPPALASLVPRAVRGRRELALYRGPALPADAWRGAAGLPETMPM